MLAGILASAFVGKLKAMPWQLWAAIGVVALLGVGGCVHGHKVKAFGKAQFQAGRAAADKDWQKALDKAHADALAWKAKAEARDVALAQALRRTHEANLRADAARAGSLLNNGSGAARCRSVDHPSTATSASGHQPASGGAASPATGMPAEDWAAVPWNFLVRSFQQCDANRSEALAWRQQHDQRQAEAAKSVSR